MAAAAARRGAAARRPNFLFLLADDHAGYAMGCDGNRLAATPNLDALGLARGRALRGTTAIRRSALRRGRVSSPDNCRTWRVSRACPRRSLWTSRRSRRQFQAAGYGTAVFGKMHLNRAAAPGLFGFDVMMTENEIRAAWMKDVKPQSIPPEVRTKPPWKPFQDPARIWLNAEKLPYPRIEAEMLGTYIADSAVRYLEQNAAQAICDVGEFHGAALALRFSGGIHRPHRSAPLCACRASVREDGRQIPIIFRDLNDDEKRGINAAYYTSVSFLDRNIGRVLAGLAAAQSGRRHVCGVHGRPWLQSRPSRPL